jgi:hypothetical protein
VKTLTLYENNDAEVEVTVRKKNPDGTKTAYDLTNTPVEYRVKASSSQPDAEARITYTTANGRITVTDAVNGKVRIDFLAVDLTPGRYIHRLDILPNGRRITVGFGTLVVQDT